ncbi:vestitone reductase isoform X2 [Arachis ipaensis]|uniref:vestitone reductase isoform X2 n=1 Tax=Arachis ipaensis TaxID=130454 RepID=UPI000A2B4405|nr:vestitone reductase isoform X2 [Arachis ipaensis]XP_025634127.1 vestitone reductase isoform X2 [Arachis hypogaea]
MEEGKGTVCVTGGTGFVASWLIKNLLQRGYCVRATVRCHSSSADDEGITTEKKKDLSYLRKLEGASKRLKVFHGELEEVGSYDEAIEGCVGVFHLAHPMDVNGEEGEEKVTKRAMEGTLGILKACLRSKTVRRVVYASSAVTVLYNNGKNALETVDEETWSEIEVCQNGNNIVSSSYLVSKILTEKAALEFGENNGLEVVSLVLPLVVGPFICPNIPSSVHIALAIILVSFYQVYQLLSQRYPHLHISLPDKLRETANGDLKFSDLSSRKLLDAGFKFKYGINEMYDGAIQCCKEKGFL